MGPPSLEDVPESNRPSRFSKAWSDALLKIRKPVTDVLFRMTGHAARNPEAYITSIIFLSVAAVAIGIYTNFWVCVDVDVLWTPTSSRSLSHGRWIADKSDFPKLPRYFRMVVHSEGKDVLGQEGMLHVFSAVDTVRGTVGYDTLCRQSGKAGVRDENGGVSCPIVTPTKFWDNSIVFFEQYVSNDTDVIRTLSRDTYPDGTPVEVLTILGNSEADSDGLLQSAQSYNVRFELPDVEGTQDFEKEAIDAVIALDDAWEKEPNNLFRVEVFSERSFSDEISRAILKDIPLVPVVFIIMSIFTCAVFFRYDWVYSRSMLGFGAVVAVLLSIMSGYGLMFTIGVPFTSMTQILPFIVFGVGLDGSFIIMGAYHRTDKAKDAVARIHDTIAEVGFSIFSTTVTSVVAFCLGCTSTIPGVYWLCLYAFPTLVFNFVYQMCFFIALIALDERRVQDSRRDWLVCSKVTSRVQSEPEQDLQGNSMNNWMARYSTLLMKPWVKVLVLLSFFGLFVACLRSATRLNQEFDFLDVMPGDSYVADFWGTAEEYTEDSGIYPAVYFRFIDQSEEAVQQEMEEYVDELVRLDAFSSPPPFFWLSDFKNFTVDESLTFEEKLDVFLADSVFRELHSRNIVRDENGKVLSSRTWLRMDNVDKNNVKNQTRALLAQRNVGKEQKANMGRSDWAFFTFTYTYYIWDFYIVAPDEMTLSTVFGIAAVTVLGTLCIPHWSAFFYVCPLISILYVDMLGVLQFAGIKINAVSYLSLVMSIGLLVDFVIHVLLRYYESTEKTRKAKVKDMLQTMGVSILIGGVSTFLGVIPLAFSTSEIFTTIFVAFLGLVTLGIGHGLILVPVLLSMFGTEELIDFGVVHVDTSSLDTKFQDDDDSEDMDYPTESDEASVFASEYSC